LKLKLPALLLLLALPSICFAQNGGHAFSSATDLSPIDSLTIFQLIDSLINLTPEEEKSQVAVRAGYNSNVVATGRPFELGQFGLSVGTAFYHKSGLFVDATGYWSNEYRPSYFLTAAAVGYMKSWPTGWSLMAEYSRYFYNLSEDYSSVSYLNNLTATAFYERKKLNMRFDYSLYTGEKTGHRFMPSISLNFEKRNWRNIKKISFYPTFSCMLGIEQVTSFDRLFTSRLEAIYRIRHNLPLFSETTVHEFGVMNYALSAPIAISFKQGGVLLNYTYNIPVKLPGETSNLTIGGYLSLSLLRYFDVGGR
jgi:hypothetical protein